MNPYFILFIAPPSVGHKQQGGLSTPLEQGLHNQFPSGISKTP